MLLVDTSTAHFDGRFEVSVGFANIVCAFFKDFVNDTRHGSVFSYVGEIRLVHFLTCYLATLIGSLAGILKLALILLLLFLHLLFHFLELLLLFFHLSSKLFVSRASSI